MENLPQFLVDILWQWQSGANPWEHQDPAKWTWEPYSKEDSLVLEQAYNSLKHETVNLKNYEINFKKMLQTHKQDKNRARRIRRQEQSRFLIDLPEPKPVVKGKKTMNEALGSFQQFVSLFMTKTFEAFELHKTLQNLPLDCHPNKFGNVVQDVIGCVGKGAKMMEDALKAKTGVKDLSHCVKQIVDEIKAHSTNFQNFLKTILKVYTMETFLPYFLNELLRNGNEEGIKVMMPYLVCLMFTFSHPEFKLKSEKPKPSFLSKNKLCFYRGTALTEAMIDFYRNREAEFSWNSVTSASKIFDVAKTFVKRSLEKAKEHKEEKIGVIFFIEVDALILENGEGIIDTLQNSCALYPNEQEVLLAPGTIYKVQKVKMTQNKEYEIGLKMIQGGIEDKGKSDFLNAAASQNKSVSSNKKIQAENKQILVEEKKHDEEGIPSQNDQNKENIKKAEIKDSSANEQIWEDLKKLLAKKDGVNLNTNIFWSALSFLAQEKKISVEKFNEYCKSNEFMLKDEALDTVLWQMDKVSKITNLNLQVKTAAISDAKLKSLLEIINCFASLKNLSLKFDSCTGISDEGLKALQILPKSLKYLSLSFQNCSKISDHGISFLDKTLEKLTDLKHLSLDFANCYNISDQGLDNLKNSLKQLASLQHLSLNFYCCSKISDKGLNNLRSSLKPLKSLQHLSLNFCCCVKISDAGLKHLKKALKPLSKLQYLGLDFSCCPEISDKGLDDLESALKLIKTLQKSSLDFSGCQKISREKLYDFRLAFKAIH